MAEIFDVVGENFFKPLTSLYKSIYYQCLRIIYDSYRTELSYGIDRELLVQKLTYFFDDLSISDIQFDDEEEIIRDSWQKASSFLRKLKEFGWVDYEIGPDQRMKVIMPGYAVSIIRNLEMVTSGRETEYQSEISAIYSLLTNQDLLHDPYPQVVKPVYDRTVDLFTALKQLNTDIKKYIDGVTTDKTAEEIISNYFTYRDEIGSQAYHRLYTSNNVSRFRNMILAKLHDIRNNRELFESVAWGYQRVESEPDLDTAKDQVRKILNDISDYFSSYDEIVKEIEKKHAKYLDSTVKRARFLLLNTNNIEGKISTVLRYLAEEFNRDEENHLDEDASDEVCALFNIFPQGFISNESIKSVPISKRITSAEDLFKPVELTEEERRALRIAAYEKNKNRFSKKNISAYVDDLLKDRTKVLASSIEINSKRDMIRLIFISLYGQTSKSNYEVKPLKQVINKMGFRYHDYEIRRKA